LIQKILPKISAFEISESVQADINQILSVALDAVSPAECVARSIKLQGHSIWITNKQIPVSSISSIKVFALGKAAQRMAAGAFLALKGVDKDIQGLVICKHIDPSVELPNHFEIMEGGHPIPSQSSIIAGKKAAEFVSSAKSEDLILCLISGGGSALMTLPVETISLPEIQELTRFLLASGAEIQEINALRKHLDQVKGGGIARFAHATPLVSLILSDVIGNPLDVIASGPTVADQSSFLTCMEILEKYQLTDRVPASIRDHLQKGANGEISDTPFADDPLFDSVTNLIIGSNLNAARTAQDQATHLGWNSQIQTTYLKGEASQVGQVLANILQQVNATGEPLARPCCLIFGGETTVTLGEEHGMGGRNLELALGAVESLAEMPNVALVTLATDGEDGPTDAAGAIVTGNTLQNANNSGISVNELLASHNSYRYFEQAGGLIQIGSTGTNVNDLAFLFAW